jgi:hypothetical protein
MLQRPRVSTQCFAVRQAQRTKTSVHGSLRLPCELLRVW